MTSIHTNVGASVALQTLRGLAIGAQAIQGQISSGLRIAAAGDDAAYWSISTTMRSDNLAVSAVGDALGLAAAKVDTAYAGMGTVVDVLESMLSRLVAATEEGIDRTKIQEEIEQLKAQVIGIAESSSFNGVNWLNTDIADMGDADLTSSFLASSFVRNARGDVQVKKIAVDLSEISLFNSTGQGLLQKAAPSDFGGFATSPPNAQPSSYESHEFTAPLTWTAGATITFDVLLDGSTPLAGHSYPSIEIDEATVVAALGTSTIENGTDFGRVIQQALADAGVPATATGSTYMTPGDPDYYSWFRITSSDTADPIYSSVAITNLVSTLPGGTAFGLENSGSRSHNANASDYVVFSESFVLDALTDFTFDLEINGGSPQAYRVTEADVNAVLGQGNGVVSSAAEWATVLQQTIGIQTGLTFSTTTAPVWNADTGAVVLVPAVQVEVDTAVHPELGSKSALRFSNVGGNDLSFDFVDIDVTDPSMDIDTLIFGVNVMLEKTISAAATLGSLKSRIALQTSFNEKLMAKTDTGIGRLVDADMNEASARLSAIQAQEQLALQTLSIANARGEEIIQLFR